MGGKNLGLRKFSLAEEKASLSSALQPALSACFTSIDEALITAACDGMPCIVDPDNLGLLLPDVRKRLYNLLSDCSRDKGEIGEQVDYLLPGEAVSFDPFDKRNSHNSSSNT